MKLLTIVNSEKALNQLGNTKLKAVLSFKLKSLIEDTKNERVKYYNIMNEKLAECGVENPDKKGVYTLKSECVDQFNSEMTELQNTEIEIKFEKLKISDLGDSKITPNVLVDLEWLFEG